MRAQVISLLVCMAMTGMLLFGHGAWIYAKARLAQVLLDGAWSRTLHGEQHAKPWRWADTWPVAKIEFSRQHRAFIVLSGASGRAMAFGPGHVDGTAAPGAIGNCVISAHRDTQFAVLHDIDIGDEIVIETRSGEAVRYRVRSIRVVKQRDTAVMADSGDRRLTLITCYPFNAIRPGGELRYAVVATAM
ncbi:MAG TPA: class GN sortase [Thermoanaerobaculia bacterium]|nr:class GN sortase [Thermoanaerobaculia bacterium]